MNYYYIVTENNVDGCGGDATEYLRSETELTEAQLEIFRMLCKAVKYDAAEKDEDVTTGDIVERAAKLFSQSHRIKMNMVGVMFAGHVTF